MTISPVENKKYCCQCGSAMEKKCPEGDTCHRNICINCGYVDYENPKILVACFATYEDKLLWMRRKYPPGEGGWFIPSGFMELAETPEEAASRELFEETCAVVRPQNLDFFLIGSIPHISQIYLAYRGEIEDINDIRVTDESLEVGLFAKDEAPLDKLSFPLVIDTFTIFYREHAGHKYGAYRAQIIDDKHIITAL